MFYYCSLSFYTHYPDSYHPAALQNRLSARKIQLVDYQHVSHIRVGDFAPPSSSYIPKHQHFTLHLLLRKKENSTAKIEKEAGD